MKVRFHLADGGVTFELSKYDRDRLARELEVIDWIDGGIVHGLALAFRMNAVAGRVIETPAVDGSQLSLLKPLQKRRGKERQNQRSKHDD